MEKVAPGFAALALNPILDAATPGESNKPTRDTTTAYRDVLEQLWLLDPVDGWLPQYTPLKRLGAAPKHFLADPALAARLLELMETDLLNAVKATPTINPKHPMFGALFEHLVALSLQVYIQACEARLAHLREQSGRHEVDLIVERGRAVVAFEIKLAKVINDGDVKHLLWLREQLGENLVNAVAISTGPQAYRRADGVAVVPLGLLGA